MSSAKINNEYFNRNPMKLLQLKIIVATQDTITRELTLCLRLKSN